LNCGSIRSHVLNQSSAERTQEGPARKIGVGVSEFFFGVCSPTPMKEMRAPECRAGLEFRWASETRPHAKCASRDYSFSVLSRRYLRVFEPDILSESLWVSDIDSHLSLSLSLSRSRERASRHRKVEKILASGRQANTKQIQDEVEEQRTNDSESFLRERAAATMTICFQRGRVVCFREHDAGRPCVKGGGQSRYRCLVIARWIDLLKRRFNQRNLI